MVAHKCTLSYSGGRNQDEKGLRPDQAKSYQGPNSTNKTGYGGTFLSSQLAIDRRITVWGQPGQKHETLVET
jgi:hypothetical protein